MSYSISPCSYDFSLLPNPIREYQHACNLARKSIRHMNIPIAAAVFFFMPVPAWAAPFMDIGPLVNMIGIGTVAVIAIVILKGVLHSRSFKGWLGEFQVKRFAMAQLDAETYRQFHDVTLPTSDGTTQIDHIIVSEYGVFVIETKNMGGWIFGDPNHPKWTQTFGKSKNSFQNPLRQNYKHIKGLEALLQIGENKLFSVVVFTGEAEFKTDMPDNVVRAGHLARYVLARTTPVLTESEVQSILLKINGTMLEQSRETSRLHVSNLNRKFGYGAEEMHRKRLLNLVKIAAILGIMIVTAFAANLLNSPTSHPKPPVDTAPSTPIQQAPIVLEQKETPKPGKTPRSEDYGILRLSAQKDTFVTLYDSNKIEVIRTEIRKGQNEEVEIRKGLYTAEILQAGKRKVSTVSFIGKTGALEF